MQKVNNNIKYQIIISVILYCSILLGYYLIIDKDIIGCVLLSTLHLFFITLFASLFNIKSEILKFISNISYISTIFVILFLNIKSNVYLTSLILVLIIFINFRKYIFNKIKSIIIK